MTSATNSSSTTGLNAFSCPLGFLHDCHDRAVCVELNNTIEDYLQHVQQELAGSDTDGEGNTASLDNHNPHMADNTLMIDDNNYITSDNNHNDNDTDNDNDECFSDSECEDRHTCSRKRKFSIDEKHAAEVLYDVSCRSQVARLVEADQQFLLVLLHSLYSNRDAIVLSGVEIGEDLINATDTIADTVNTVTDAAESFRHVFTKKAFETVSRSLIQNFTHMLEKCKQQWLNSNAASTSIKQAKTCETAKQQSRPTLEEIIEDVEAMQLLVVNIGDSFNKCAAVLHRLYALNASFAAHPDNLNGMSLSTGDDASSSFEARDLSTYSHTAQQEVDRITTILTRFTADLHCFYLYDEFKQSTSVTNDVYRNIFTVINCYLALPLIAISEHMFLIVQSLQTKSSITSFLGDEPNLDRFMQSVIGCCEAVQYLVLLKYHVEEQVSDPHATSHLTNTQLAKIKGYVSIKSESTTIGPRFKEVIGNVNHLRKTILASLEQVSELD